MKATQLSEHHFKCHIMLYLILDTQDTFLPKCKYACDIREYSSEIGKSNASLLLGVSRLRQA